MLRNAPVNVQSGTKKPDTAAGTAPGAPVPAEAVEQPTSPGQWKSPLLRDRAADRAAFKNVALSYASDILKSEAARVDGQLLDDFVALLRGNAVYINDFMCREKDLALYDKLKGELVAATGAQMSDKGTGLIEWSRHQVFENPTDLSQTFNDIVDALAEYFDVDVYASRLNYYRDGTQWKPQHHDSHAYGGRKEREDFTVGITLGSERSLLFVHVASGREFSFPQRNGNCFAFTGELNQTFTHGVPRAHAAVGDRFSIIAWGRRRTLNDRNGGAPSSLKEQLRTSDGRDIVDMDDAIDAAKRLVSSDAVAAKGPSAGGKAAGAPAKKKKNRLQ